MSEFTTKAFNDYIVQGKLMGNRCTVCGELHLPPRQICSKCGSQRLEWLEFDGKGVIEAVTYNKALSTPFKNRVGIAVGIIRLDEGPSISGLLATDEPEKMTVGTRVSFIVLKNGDKSILAFRKN